MPMSARVLPSRGCPTVFAGGPIPCAVRSTTATRIMWVAESLGTRDCLERLMTSLGSARCCCTAASSTDVATDQTHGLAGGGRGLGWAVSQPWFGQRASAGAFGHTGFTGTSLLIDPSREVVIVLLTNRIHPSAESNAIVEFRPVFHVAVLDALDKCRR